MMRFNNLSIIGTSHIAKESIRQVERFIENENPGMVCVELDRKRYMALIKGKKGKIRLSDIRRIGFTGFLFSVIGGYVEEKLGKYVGVSPGEEMITAIKAAEKKGIKVALIDQDIEITLKRFSQEFTLKEKIRLLSDLIMGLFFKKRELRKIGVENLDLNKVPPERIIRKMLIYVKKRYPNFYKVLIEERNEVMARNIVAVMNTFPDKGVLAIVGAGHEEELMMLVKKGFLS